MGTVVCQGLQSCLESQLVESRALKLRLSSPKPHLSESLELALKPCFSDSNAKEIKEKCHFDEISQKLRHASPLPDLGGWSFLQSLSSTKQPTEKETTYAHPSVRRSSSRLSDKSLELCTENLGSETGTDIMENNMFLFASSDSILENSPPQREPQKKPRQHLEAKKANSRSFPPPLTIMTASKFLQVRPHREEGRLIIKAVQATSMRSCFQVERSHGRLRLSFVKDSASKFDSLGVTLK